MIGKVLIGIGALTLFMALFSTFMIIFIEGNQPPNIIWIMWLGGIGIFFGGIMLDNKNKEKEEKEFSEKGKDDLLEKF